jgi:DNA-binding response OmpR family regulator
MPDHARTQNAEFVVPMRKNVLVVDDDRDHAESIADLLIIHGYTVETAFSGEDGLAMFRGQHFDLVLMDMKLPGMNGVDAFFECRKVRADAPVMMMTGYSVETLIEKAIDNGALGVMRKPFSVGELIQVIDRQAA